MKPDAPLRRMTLLLLLCTALIPNAPAEEGEFFPPDELGPYPVGVTTMTLVDPTRVDLATRGSRTLLTEVWYPATDETRDLPPNKLSDFLLRGAHNGLNVAVRMAFGSDASALDPSFKNIAVRDARVRDGKFPLIVFSHGNGGLRNQSTFLCDYLASHGYVVVAPDHTGNSRVTVVQGRLVLFNPDGIEAAREHRPRDVSFLIDRMEAFNRGEDSRFATRIDMDRIGVAGHSFGGWTAAAVINEDPRVDAILALTPVFPDRTNFDTPVMVLVATEDLTIGVEGNEKARRYFEESRGPRYLVEMPNAGHFSPTDMFQVDPDYGDGIGKGVRVTEPGASMEFLGMKETYAVINTYGISFFGRYVKGQEDYESWLEDNPFGSEVMLSFDHARPEPEEAPIESSNAGPTEPVSATAAPRVSATTEIGVVGDPLPAAAITNP